MTGKKAVEMAVVGLMMDRNTETPVVILQECDGDGCLPIWIGATEATAIASFLKNVELTRPLTHDLMVNILDKLSVKIDRVVISEIKDNTYYAEILISRGTKNYIIDARPSDAIALAVKTATPIFVAEDVLAIAKSTGAYGRMLNGEVDFDNKEKLSDDRQEIDEEEAFNNDQLSFKDIEKDKWKELLDSLDPDDFKYKV